MILLEALRRWADKRRTIRRRWQQDGRSLVTRDERTAYYEAQRLVARSRVHGNAGEAFHWAKVAAEVVRIAPGAEMDIDVVRAVVDEELDRLRPGSTRRI
jgi:hypothetical protein